MRYNFCYPLNNLGLFSIAPHLVIALPTLLQFFMSFVDWFMASFLYCFPYSYRSSNYCDNSNSCRSFTLLKALVKSKSNLFAVAYKSEKEQQLSLLKQRSKELIPKRMQRGLRVLTLQGAIKKSPILFRG